MEVQTPTQLDAVLKALGRNPSWEAIRVTLSAAVAEWLLESHSSVTPTAVVHTVGKLQQAGIELSQEKLYDLFNSDPLLDRLYTLRGGTLPESEADRGPIREGMFELLCLAVPDLARSGPC